MSYGLSGAIGNQANTASNNALAEKEATALMDRMRMLLSSFSENCASATSIADRIVGHEPEKIGNSKNENAAPSPYAFLAQLALLISELETLSAGTGHQLNRLHRSF